MNPKNIPGRFVHNDLMTTDPEKSRRFFTELFGWTTEDVDMGGGEIYTLLSDRVRSFGGIATLDQTLGVPSHWRPYISCPSVDDACALATNLGATLIIEPVDIPGGYGRFALVADPQGAVFSPYAKDNATEYDDTIEAGSIEWYELCTSDPEAATALYTRLFGWETESMHMDSGPYTVLRSAGMAVGGIMKKMDEMPVSAWIPYIRVPEINQALKDMRQLGGEVYFDPLEIPGIGQISWGADPTGAIFAVLEPALVPAV